MCVGTITLPIFSFSIANYTNLVYLKKKGKTGGLDFALVNRNRSIRTAFLHKTCTHYRSKCKMSLGSFLKSRIETRFEIEDKTKLSLNAFFGFLMDREKFCFFKIKESINPISNTCVTGNDTKEQPGKGSHICPGDEVIVCFWKKKKINDCLCF